MKDLVSFPFPSTKTHTEKGPITMGDSLSIYRAIIREHAPAFAGPLTWYANGKRGHLHASGSCAKLRKHGVVTISLALRDAIEDHTVCGECLNYGAFTADQRETYRLATTLLDVTRRAEMNLGELAPGRTAIKAARNHLFRRSLVDSVRLDQHAYGLEHWVERVRSGIEESIPAMPPLEDLQDDCVKVAAPRVLFRRFSDSELDPEFWGGNEVIAVTGAATNGYPAYRNNETPLLFFTKAWLTKLQDGLTPQETNTLLLTDGAIVDLMATPDKQQLERCGIVVDMIEGETLWSFTERNWKTQILAALNVAAEAMTRHYEQLVAPKDPVLIGHQNHGTALLRSQACSDNGENAIGGLLDLVGDNEHSIALCHPTVAQYLRGKGHYGSWTEPVRVPGPLSREILETTVALWEPRNRYSAYEHLGAALEAARAL